MLYEAIFNPGKLSDPVTYVHINDIICKFAVSAYCSNRATNSLVGVLNNKAENAVVLC